MPASTELPRSVDLSHHLNSVAKGRAPSPLKDLLRYMADPEMLSLAGGTPHPSFFPFVSLQAEVYPADTFLDTMNPKIPEQLDTLYVPKMSNGDKSCVHLDSALQYSAATGMKQIIDFAKEFTSTIIQPAYGDWDILVHSGNTDGWAKIQGMLSTDGDNIFVEEYTYPSAQAVWIPKGSKAIPLEMDSQGIRADKLRETLVNWDNTHAGQKKPHIIYTVPIAQNPTGTTMGLERKKEIYQVAVDYDLIIVEDDPYYALQFGEFKENAVQKQTTDPTEYINGLVPSFLRIDYQGRVIRMDTFSKVIAPGARLGYFTCNPLFSERLLRATEVDTQTASGFSQAIIATFLEKWGQKGFLTWMANLCEQYRIRRDWLYEAFRESFNLVQASTVPELGLQGEVGYFKSGSVGISGVAPISFVCPTAGMFIFCRIDLTQMPRYKALLSNPSIIDAEGDLIKEIWLALIEKKTLLVPGYYYHPFVGEGGVGSEKGFGHFRFTFSIASHSETTQAVSRFESVLREFWQPTA